MNHNTIFHFLFLHSQKYLLEIFGDKINALENKQIFYEKVLKKSDQLEGGRKNNFSNKNVFKKDV